MAIKVYKAITNGQRQKSTLKNEEITKTTPEKSLFVTKKKTNGRNNQGKITVRHRGGGIKRNKTKKKEDLLFYLHYLIRT